jgi:hypothetical protein
MTLVRIIKDWNYPNLLRQTPGQSGLWDGIIFTLDPVEECDYVIICNRVPAATTIYCPPEHIWQITQEPPVPEYRWHKLGFPHFYRVYTQNTEFKGSKFIYSQPALPWHIDRDYDFLKCVEPLEKTGMLSWVTSSGQARKGQRHRMTFLTELQKRVEFDLWGRGFTPLADKWDGLAPYRYTLAIENHHGRYYWSEKLADCFLSWSMPIYYGCTHISDYFPPESMVQIDIRRPQEAIEIVHETIQSDFWRRNRDAIAHARELILDQYQFFPYMVSQIRAFERQHPHVTAQTVHLPELPFLYPKPPQPLHKRARHLAGRIKRRVQRGL